MLVKSKDRVDLKLNGWNKLHLVCSRGGKYQKKSKDVNFRINKILSLIKKGEQVMHLDKNRRTPIDLEIEHEDYHIEVIDILVKNGAILDMRVNTEGLMFKACKKRNCLPLINYTISYLYGTNLNCRLEKIICNAIYAMDISYTMFLYTLLNPNLNWGTFMEINRGGEGLFADPKTMYYIKNICLRKEKSSCTFLAKMIKSVYSYAPSIFMLNPVYDENFERYYKSTERDGPESIMKNIENKEIKKFDMSPIKYILHNYPCSPKIASIIINSSERYHHLDSPLSSYLGNKHISPEDIRDLLRKIKITSKDKDIFFPKLLLSKYATVEHLQVAINTAVITENNFTVKINENIDERNNNNNNVFHRYCASGSITINIFEYILKYLSPNLNFLAYDRRDVISILSSNPVVKMQGIYKYLELILKYVDSFKISPERKDIDQKVLFLILGGVKMNFIDIQESSFICKALNNKLYSFDQDERIPNSVRSKLKMLLLCIKSTKLTMPKPIRMMITNYSLSAIFFSQIVRERKRIYYDLEGKNFFTQKKFKK